MHKIDLWWEPIVQHRELYSMLSGDLNGKEIQKRGIYVVAQMVGHLPATQEIWVWSLGWEDPLEKGMATHSSILAWRIAWTV